MTRPAAQDDVARLRIEPLEEARREAAACTACPLYADATRTVFGEGQPGAAVMLVGEQPGSHEDLEGRPFVGPAGRLLDRALSEAGIERSDVYVTNAVKHFKFARRGKLRIHQRPLIGEVTACRPWLAREIEIVNPRIIVTLGATAGRAIFGPGFRVTQSRGRVVHLENGRLGLGTIHPSALLRIEDAQERAYGVSRLADDLALTRRAADNLPASVVQPSGTATAR